MINKIYKYNLEYWSGSKLIETPVVNMTKGFCNLEKKKLVSSGRFSLGKFKMKRIL